MILKSSAWLLLWIMLLTLSRSLDSQSAGTKKHCRSTHAIHDESPSLRGLFSPSFLESQRFPYNRHQQFAAYQPYENPRYIYPVSQFPFQGNPYVGNTHIATPPFIPRVPPPMPLTQLSYRRSGVQPTDSSRVDYKKNFRDKIIQNIERLNQLEKEKEDEQLVRAAAKERDTRVHSVKVDEEPIMILKGISSEESNETIDEDMEKEFISSEVSSNRTRRSPDDDTVEIATFHPDKILVPEDIRRKAEEAVSQTKVDESSYISMADAAKIYNSENKPIKPIPVPPEELPPATMNETLPPHVHIGEGDPINLVSRKLFERPLERSNGTSKLQRGKRAVELIDKTNLEKRTIKKDLSNPGNVTNSTLPEIVNFSLIGIRLFGLKSLNSSENMFEDE